MELVTMGRQMGLYVRARLRFDDHGSSLVEYVLLVALIAIVCLLAIAYVGDASSGRLSTVASQVASS